MRLMNNVVQQKTQKLVFFAFFSFKTRRSMSILVGGNKGVLCDKFDI